MRRLISGLEIRVFDYDDERWIPESGIKEGICVIGGHVSGSITESVIKSLSVCKVTEAVMIKTVGGSSGGLFTLDSSIIVSVDGKKCRKTGLEILHNHDNMALLCLGKTPGMVDMEIKDAYICYDTFKVYELDLPDWFHPLIKREGIPYFD